jgi:GH15 family glucan-1,4-alpha-glucosidase
MAKVVIAEKLKDEILKKFKRESKTIFKQMYSLQDNPKKGKLLGSFAGIIIKEIRHKSFRFYFITEGNKLKIMDKSILEDTLMRFVRMSDKKHQQETINEIKKILIKIGPKGFN